MLFNLIPMVLGPAHGNGVVQDPERQIMDEYALGPEDLLYLEAPEPTLEEMMRARMDIAASDSWRKRHS